jgi:hypothetical protein
LPSAHLRARHVLSAAACPLPGCNYSYTARRQINHFVGAAPDEPLAYAPLVLSDECAVRRARDRLLAEESVSKLPSLPRREPRLREYLHDFIRELSLLRRKRGRIGVPAETSANIRLDPRFRWCEVIGKLVQLAHLLEKRLKLPIVDRHARGIARRADSKLALDETFAKPPLAFAHEYAAEFREPIGSRRARGRVASDLAFRRSDVQVAAIRSLDSGRRKLVFPSAKDERCAFG